MCDQLDRSMGSYMQYFQVLCILLSAVMIYLLSKIIIEKNENAISMTKMFLFVLIGYLIVAWLDFRRIKKIPMDQALKNTE